MNSEFFALLLLLVLAIPYLIITKLSVTATPARRASTRRPSRHGNRSHNRSRNRRRQPVNLTPGMSAGLVRPDRNTTCARCHGPILRGEDCRRTANRRGLICPGCWIS